MFFFISPVHSLNNGCAVAAAARATTIYYFTCYITTTASNAYSCPCNVMMKSTGADTMIIVRATPLSCVPSISVSLCSMLYALWWTLFFSAPAHAYSTTYRFLCLFTFAYSVLSCILYALVCGACVNICTNGPK